jgi:dTMP kinase
MIKLELSTKRGMFVVFEAIDGGGQDTQLDILYRKIKSWDKYEHILATHEPTKSNVELTKRLERDKDPYSNAEEMAELYVEDRTEHTWGIIRPSLLAGINVLCSRYAMSTCAFQQTQGIPLEKLLDMHKHRGILIPDLIFFLDVEGEVAEERRKKRGVPREKFEVREFMDKANANYNHLYELSKKNPDLFGRVIKIDGNPKPEIVAESIEKVFSPFYEQWAGRVVSNP